MVVVPSAGAVPAAASAAQERQESPVAERAPFRSAGEIPGVRSEPLAEPLVPAPAEKGPDVDLPVIGPEGPVVDPDATVGEELVERRSEFAQSFRRSDGLLEVRVSPEPVAFEAEAGRWELIDTAVRETKAGLVADRNKFKVAFGDSAAGVSVELESGHKLASRPSALDGVAPAKAVRAEVDESDPSVVWYRQVWPGVDVRYTVRVAGISEDVVYTAAPAGAGAVSFAVSGVELDAGWSLPAPETPLDPAVGVPQRSVVRSSVLSEVDGLGVTDGRARQGGELGAEVAKPEQVAAVARELAGAERPVGALPSLAARGDLASEVRFGPLVVMSGKDANFVADEAARPLVRSKVLSPGESLMEVSVDPAWMAGLPADAFPVVLDPDLGFGPDWYRSYLGGTEPPWV